MARFWFPPIENHRAKFPSWSGGVAFPLLGRHSHEACRGDFLVPAGATMILSEL